MYGHGFATLFLAECYGMSRRSELREKLRKAVLLIVNTQNEDGGWRYLPQRLDADISVTICQVMALRAARNAGLHVPRETIDRCIGYVKDSQNADGGFRYQIQGGVSAFARSAAGVVALYSAGVYEGPEIDQGIEYLLKFVPKRGVVRRETYYFYGHYYAVQAMWQAGGQPWVEWYEAIRDELRARQHDDGSWRSPISNEYATAMSCIILQVPDNYLPIFQR
jgi:squalene cyclase